ncbi:hypothetical protein GJ744_002406 [Endocarpon pusillum]|uniref:Alpha/beta hydrolase fold-3 domain-containing protein n=1 Tax=Endocarpon pusillum TaxID=364733 RepID=A0A8H7E6H5_9EURO|nr:hypothetical protein GJ744_002406 [Endocarpon pusillum]
MCGFSAGGNLFVAIAQMEGLRCRRECLIPIYLVVDFKGSYKGSLKTTKDGKRDTLEKALANSSIGATYGQGRTAPILC